MLTERQPRFFRAAFALVAYAALSHSYAGEATHDVQNVPSAIIGQWQVSAAHVDRLATRTQQYDEGDPRLVGRIFTFSPNALENNTADDSDTCRGPVATVLRLDRNSLFEKSFGERLTGPRFVASDIQLHRRSQSSACPVKGKSGMAELEPLADSKDHGSLCNPRTLR
jgi:hypothetical protein